MGRCSRRDGATSEPERGAALVETALVMVPLMLLAFGIISFSSVMAVKQNLVQATSEGARAAVVATSDADAITRAEAAVREAVSAWGTCGEAGLTCPTPTIASCPDSGGDCITVTVRFDQRTHPLVNVPLVNLLTPAVVRSTSSARLDS